MGKKLDIRERYADQTINLALDTLDLGKQAIVFVNTRRGAESQAEKIAGKMRESHKKLADKVLNVLSSPTKQCRRLAKCVRQGTAFHHSGLHYKQRKIIENAFRKKRIKFICATPTLAAGVNLPAFRVIVRDLKRYAGRRGMQWIPVLEYEQMSGRCGRPGYDDYGEAICVSKSRTDKEKVWEKYVEGDPEELISKLAVEPVLRIYVLSLVASDFCTSKEELYDFFEGTFYATQYKDSMELRAIIDRMAELLIDWEFIKGEKAEGDFVSAADMVEDDGKLEATRLGKRISELYLDPYTANYIVECLRRAMSQKHSEFSWLQMISNTLEMRPQLRVKKSEYEDIREESLQYLEELFESEPSEFDYEYDQFLNSLKTALFFRDWMNEKDEDYLLETYGIRPGEVHAKKETADWLLYATQEIGNILGFKKVLKEVARVRERLKHGVKTELLPLLKLKNIGRVRARKMFKRGVKTIGDVKEVDVPKLVDILGKKTAINVKKQVGIDLDKEKVPKKKKKGQIALDDFTD